PLDEVRDLDLARLLRLGRFELVVAHDDELAAAQVEPPHDAVLPDLVAGAFVDLLVTDAVRGPLLELVEMDALVRRRRVQPDGDVDQSEAEGTLPDRAWHVRQITSPGQVHHLVTGFRHTDSHGKGRHQPLRPRSVVRSGRTRPGR